MDTWKKKYVFCQIEEKWASPEFTIKDREILYNKLINEKYDLSDEYIRHLYDILLSWLDCKDYIKEEILLWYDGNGYLFFAFHMFSFLAVCAIMKLKSPTCVNRKGVTDILFQSIFKTLHRIVNQAFNFESAGNLLDAFFDECALIFKNDLTVQQLIFRVVCAAQKQIIMHKSGEQNPFFSFALLCDVMCVHAHVQPEMVSARYCIEINTLLAYHGRSEKNERGITINVRLQAIPGRFGELYPAQDTIKETRFEKTFLDSLHNVFVYIKDNVKLWPEHCDICWTLLPDDRDFSISHKTVTGESIGAAFAMGILALFARLFPEKPDFPLRKELQELDPKFVGISAAIDKKGRLGKVGSIWQKLLEAARVKIGFIIIAAGQDIPDTAGLIIIQAETIFDAIKKLYEESGPEKINEKIKRFLLKYATEIKELECRCNEAFKDEDATNIKASIRFHDKPRVYVEDIMEICSTYGEINKKHPLIILLDRIKNNALPPQQEEIQELMLLYQNSLSRKKKKNEDVLTRKKTASVPRLKIKRVIIKDINMEFFKKKLPPLKRKGNPYIYRTMIPRPDLFFGRLSIIRTVKQRICTERPQSISFLGERRIGKSSLLNYITFWEGDDSYLDDPFSYIFLYLDCQGFGTIDESAFIAKIFAELRKKLKDAIEFQLKKPGDDLRFLCEEITNKGLKFILLLDEFESITKNKFFTPSFYALLRSLANNYAMGLITTSRKSLKDMCVSEEISDSPFFNIFTIQHLGLFTNSEAEALIEKPSLEFGIPLKELSGKIIEESGLHPFFLQIMCCSWFDYLETAQFTTDMFVNKITVKDVVDRFREESKQHFEYIYDTMQEKERLVLNGITKGNAFNPDSAEIESLKRKGYITEDKAGKFHVFCTEFKRFISQYSL